MKIIKIGKYQYRVTEKFKDVCLIALCIIVALWIFISWFDVLSNQHCGGTEAKWNLFYLIIKLAKILGTL